MDYVTDTHPLVWFFTEDARLGKNALTVLTEAENAGTIIVPAVVLAEIMFIAKKGRITISFDETLSRIEDSDNFAVSSLDADILKIADKIESELEMHDKLIAATALQYGASLITKDDAIRQSGVVPTIW